MILFFIRIIKIVLTKDVSFFPNLCTPLPEELELCVGQTITTNLKPSDFENSPIACNNSTSPEKCYFLAVDKEININEYGQVSFEGVKKGTFSYDVLVFDKNVNADFFVSFDYYNMATKVTLTYTVFDSTDIPPVFFNSSRTSCEFCPNKCEDCIFLQCGVPFIGFLSTENQGRLDYFLVKQVNIDIKVLKSGYFYMTPDCKNSSQEISWTILAKDKRTKCSKLLTWTLMRIQKMDFLTSGVSEKTLKRKN